MAPSDDFGIFIQYSNKSKIYKIGDYSKLVLDGKVVYEYEKSSNSLKLSKSIKGIDYLMTVSEYISKEGMEVKIRTKYENEYGLMIFPNIKRMTFTKENNLVKRINDSLSVHLDN